MSATMTITITEDDAPDGCVEADFEIEGFDIETARTNGDLPPAVLLGAEMMKLLDDMERDGKIESYGGRPAPPPHGHLPSRFGR